MNAALEQGPPGMGGSRTKKSDGGLFVLLDAQMHAHGTWNVERTETVKGKLQAGWICNLDIISMYAVDTVGA